MLACDIIIPTYNNARTLPLVLAALQQQEVPAGWTVRVIISDDGSKTVPTVPTSSFTVLPGWQAPLVLRHAHAGVASARNQAIVASPAPLLLFLGADIILRPGALAAHLRYHEQHPQANKAALGMIKWDPRVHPSALMEWLTHGGPQNDFDGLLGSRQADAGHYFYGSHLSLKRAFLGRERFSAAYKSYGWEDIDLGRRLAERGLQLAVLHQAIGLHHHFYSVSDVYRRQRAVGRSFNIFLSAYPALRGDNIFSWSRYAKTLLYWLTGTRYIIYWLLLFSVPSFVFPRLYIAATSGEFWLARLMAEKFGGKRNF